MKKKKTVLITGASSGIGFFLAKEFAMNYYDLVIVSKDKENLKNAKDSLSKLANVEMFARDLTIKENIDNLYKFIKLKKIDIDVLVNNAGFGTYGPFNETSLEKELDMIQLNISAIVHLTKLITNDMIIKGNGKILNVSSTAAFQPGPNMAVYFATKSFILSFSSALTVELKPHNIQVTALCPGPTKTNFILKSEHCGETRIFKNLLSPQRVAKEGFEALENNEMVHVVGSKNKLLSILPKFSPIKMSTKISNYYLTKIDHKNS